MSHNVTKCHPCHAKRHHNLHGNIRKRRGFAASPIDSATRDETRGCKKTSISCETSGNFHSWHHDKRTSFAASPIDTARPRENQRRETRQVEAPKRAFPARLPPIFTLCSFKINVFLRVFLRTCKFAFFFCPSPSRLSPGRNTVFVPVERIVQRLASFPHWGIKREQGPVRSPSGPRAMRAPENKAQPRFFFFLWSGRCRTKARSCSKRKR